MTKRIFRSVCFAALCVFAASMILFMGVLYDYFSDVQKKQLRMQTGLAVQGTANEGMSYFDGLVTKDYRITWIGTDGSVLYDSRSDTDEMENHLQREEIKQALEKGTGESSRYSDTMMERLLYCAQRLPDGTVIRLSVSQNTMFTLILGMLRPICIIFLAAVILSLFLASRLSKKIVSPLNKLNLDDPLNNDCYDEIAPLLGRINSQQRRIRQQGNELIRKKREFETVTSGMREGIVLLNGSKNILSINAAAKKILSADEPITGENILSVSRDPALREVVEGSQSGAHTEAVMRSGSFDYEIGASPIISDDKTVCGTVLLFLDVTEKNKAEQMRREFSANVSHELKTPLQTISGCAELMANGMVRTEDIPDFSSRIYTESRRLIRLVEDIIRLSHLDEGADDMKRERIDLYFAASETVRCLIPEAEAVGVEISLKGEHAEIIGIPQLIRGIIYNLCDNAIKYNRKGGTVNVEIISDEKNIKLSVEDTGIGISEENRSRIFERFYRVDKSHSREIGGTGLGLSIVKHAAELHNAAIELQSELGKGTKITVIFPKE